MTKRDHHTEKLRYKHSRKSEEKKPRKKYSKAGKKSKSIKNISVSDIDYLTEMFEEDE